MSDSEDRYELTILVSGDKMTIRTSNDTLGKTGKFIFEDLTKDTIELFQAWLADKNKFTIQKEIQVMGAYLFQALFDNDTRPYLENALETAKKADKRLRILLAFSKESSDLYSLPWEYMYYRSSRARSFFLSTEVDLVLARYIDLEEKREPIAPSERELRVLVLVSKPKKMPPQGLPLAEVIGGPVIEAIEKLKEKYPILLEVENEPTIANFLDRLESVKPHIIHFIGHGQYNEGSHQGEMAFLAPDKINAQPVGDSQFVEYLVNKKAIPKLCLLHMCEGGVVEFKKQFAGMAPQLILAGVDAVVAMQYPITNEAAIAFSRAFYKELAEGKPVDVAVQQGRWHISYDDPKQSNSRVFGVPVLYMHSSDGIILPPSEVDKKVGNKSVSRQDQEQKAPETQEESPERNTVPLPSGASRIIQNQAIATAIPVPATSQSPAALRVNPATATLTSLPPRLQLSLRKTALEAEGGGLSREEINALLETLPWRTMAPAAFCAELDRLTQEAEGMASLVYELMRDELNAWLQSNQ